MDSAVFIIEAIYRENRAEPAEKVAREIPRRFASRDRRGNGFAGHSLRSSAAGLHSENAARKRAPFGAARQTDRHKLLGFVVSAVHGRTAIFRTSRAAVRRPP